MKQVLAFLLALLCMANAKVPDIDITARIKQHYVGGTNGDLVEGEEDMRKIIIQWEAIPGALEYQVCHNCIPTETDGDLHTVPITQTRGGRPMYIKKDAPLGMNSFQVRVSLAEGELTEWSKQRNFNVDEPGSVHHEEL